MKNKLNTWATLLLTAGIGALPLTTPAAVWTTTGQFGQYTFSTGYAVNNDCWGSGYGPQTLSVDTASGSAPHFWAASNQSGSSVKTYPDARLNINKSITSLTKLVGDFNTGSTQGACDFAFDCWVPSEVMVWTQWSGGAHPNGTLYQSNVSISGVSYNVYHGSYWSFLRVNQTTSGSADLAGVFKWLVNNGHLANGTVGSCQYGIEIISGNSTWTVHSCSFSQ
jgi:hypothetical protein